MALTDIRLDRRSRFPLYLQIKNQIKDMILENLLPGGKRLPPTRELAQALGVNRSTVVSAYSELIAEGLISSHIGRGTVVDEKEQGSEFAFMPQPLNWSEFFAAVPKLARLSFYEAFLWQSPGDDFISLGIGVPDPDQYPFPDLKKVLNKVLEENWKQVLQQMPPEGYYPFRKVLADWIVPEGRTFSAEDVLITSGAAQALYLICRLLLTPGDMVAVENPTSTNGLMAFRAAEAKIIDIPIDSQGMRVDILDNLLARHKVRLIYTIPTFQNPSGTVLSLERRLKLLDLAQRYGVPIVEEDPYSKLYYDQIPPLSLRSLDKHDCVIYVGTFSKVLFQGLRIGWVLAPRPVINQLAEIKYVVDLHTSSLEQYTFYEFIREGLLEKHLKKVRKIYSGKRDLMISALSKYCPDCFRWDTPKGGISLWCKLSESLNAADLIREAISKKVIFIEGKMFAAQGNLDEWLRLNFTYINAAQIEEGIRRLSQAAQRLKERGKNGRNKA
jgi:2-aminoadipate transaminase